MNLSSSSMYVADLSSGRFYSMELYDDFIRKHTSIIPLPGIKEKAIRRRFRKLGLDVRVLIKHKN